MKPYDHLQRAIRIVGGQRLLGLRLKVSQQAVSAWLERGVPATRCPDIETATDGAVTKADLRPELFV